MYRISNNIRVRPRQEGVEIEVRDIRGEWIPVYLPVGCVFEIEGISDPVWYLTSVWPNGIIMIDSRSSIPAFHSWKRLLRFTALWDAIKHGGVVIK